MRKVFFYLLFFVVGNISAQNISLPTFQGKEVVARISENSSKVWIAVSDGIIKSHTETFTEPDCPKITAEIIRILREQGFKLTLTNGGPFGSNYTTTITNYIFQKE